MENPATVERATGQTAIVDSSESDAVLDHTVIEEELLIEEISIDGMCGVY